MKIFCGYYNNHKLLGASDSSLWTRYQWIQLKYFKNNNNDFEYLLNEDCSINFKFFLPFLCPFGGNRIFYEPLGTLPEIFIILFRENW